MKIIIEEKTSREDEDLIIVRCASLNESVLKLLQQLKAGDERITCTKNGTIARIRPDDVYYFESVDNKTFLYTEREIYEIRQKLYEIEDSYAGLDFFRCSKSIIVNLSKIRFLSPVLGSRLEATLLNDEKIIISRQYVAALKVLLKI